MAKPAVGSIYRVGKASYNYEVNTLGNTLGIYQVIPKAQMTAVGTAYNDYLIAFGNSDRIDGGAGDDWLFAGNGNNTVVGGDGNDNIITRTGSYTSNIIDLIPQTDRPYYAATPAVSVKKSGKFVGDVIHDGKGDDLIDSGMGDDQIYLGSGNNQLILGKGNDWVHLDSPNYDISTAAEVSARKREKVKIRLEEGDDWVSLGATIANAGAISVASTSLYSDQKGNMIDFGMTNYIKNAKGFHEYDYAYKSKITLYAGSGNDLVMAGAGDDILYGDSGNDHIHGGAGADYIDAGIGDDVVVTGPGADRVFLAEGADVVYASFGDIISFTAKDRQTDSIRIDPLLLTYEEGIIVKSKYDVVKDPVTGKASLTLVPIERLGKIVINYPEVGYDKIDLSKLFDINGIKVVDIAKPATGADLTMAVLTGISDDAYIHYDHNYAKVKDLNANVKLINSKASSIFDLPLLSDVRKLMSRIPDSENLIQNKAGYAFIDLPITNGSTVDVIEIHLVGVTSAQAHDMLIVI